MFRLVIIALCAVILTTDRMVQGYTVVGRSRDYGAYSSGFVGLPKDTNADLASYASHRYSTVSTAGQSSSGGNFPSSSYSESAQSPSYSSHSSSPEALNSVSSSYTTDGGHGSSEAGPSYSSSAERYASTSSQAPVSFGSYSESSQTTGSSSSEHNSGEYASQSPYAGSSPSLSGFGPKAAAYASPHGHGSSGYTSGGLSFLPGPAALSHGSSYPGGHLNSYPGGRPGASAFSSSHGSYPEALRFTSGSSLNNYISPHSKGGLGSFSHSPTTASGHRVSPFMVAAPSNTSPNFVKGYSHYPGAYPKGGNKFIIIKDSSAGHAGMIHSAEPNFPSRMFAGSAGYKIRSAGPFSGGPSSGFLGHPPGYAAHGPAGGFVNYQ